MIDNNNSLIHNIFFNEQDELRFTWSLIGIILMTPFTILMLFLGALFTNFGNSCFKEEYRDYDESFI